METYRLHWTTGDQNLKKTADRCSSVKVRVSSLKAQGERVPFRGAYTERLEHTGCKLSVAEESPSPYRVAADSDAIVTAERDCGRDVTVTAVCDK